MSEVASKLGGFIPGAEPKCSKSSTTSDICGTYRAGSPMVSTMTSSQGVPGNLPRDSVVDKASRVWGQQDLYLGGCGVIPTRSACDPTLTAACFAIYAAERLIESMNGVKSKNIQRS